MHTNEAIEMMQRCRDEIQSLQKRIEYLAPRAEAYEVLRNIVIGGEGMPMGQDVVHLLDNAIKREQDRAKQAEPPDRSKEYRGGVVSAQEGAQTIDSPKGPERYATVSGVEQYRAAREAEKARNVGKRPGYGYDGVKD